MKKHPLETNVPKEGGMTIDKIEKITGTVWVSMERWNNLPSRSRHTASDGRRFAYLSTIGGWCQVSLA